MKTSKSRWGSQTTSHPAGARLRTKRVRVVKELTKARKPKDAPDKTSSRLTETIPKTPTLATLRRALISSEQRYQSLVQTVPAPIFLVSPEYTVLEVNQGGERLIERKRKTIVGKDLFHVLGGDGRSGLERRHLDRVMAGRAAKSIEARMLRSDGSGRLLLWNATRVLDSRGRAQGAILVAQDITEREEAAQSLTDREARMHSIISTAPDAILTIDARGIVQSFSATAEKLFGYEAAEVVGRNVKMLMPQPHRAAHDNYLRRYHKTGEKRIIGIGRQVEARRKDGSIFPMELAVGEVKLGETHIFTGFIRDITVRAKLEQDLRHAQKMEAIGQLTGGLAHDFNNLLTVILGNLEMLDRHLERQESRALLGEAQAAAELGSKLASRLLAFGRRQPLNPKPIELRSLTSGMMDLLRRTLGEQVKIEARLSEVRTVTADPGQVENALLNLAINARDAMPNGGRLVIETADADIDQEYAAAHGDIVAGPYALLAVSDSGVGMSPAVLERAFEPFFTTKGPGNGSGLGLSMVYGFVKQSGGHVQIYSEQERGTSVRIYLPVDGQEHDLWPTDTPAKQPNPIGDEVVLVVEDDTMVRTVSVRRLKELGYRVIAANDGPSALALVATGARFDLLFTDLVMPGGMTGMELAQQVRSRQPDTPILFTSGYADPTIVQGGILTERADWLPKPYSTADLAIKLRRLLDR